MYQQSPRAAYRKDALYTGSLRRRNDRLRAGSLRVDSKFHMRVVNRHIAGHIAMDGLHPLVSRLDRGEDESSDLRVRRRSVGVNHRILSAKQFRQRRHVADIRLCRAHVLMCRQFFRRPRNRRHHMAATESFLEQLRPNESARSHQCNLHLTSCLNTKISF